MASSGNYESEFKRIFFFRKKKRDDDGDDVGEREKETERKICLWLVERDIETLTYSTNWRVSHLFAQRRRQSGKYRGRVEGSVV